MPDPGSPPAVLLGGEAIAVSACRSLGWAGVRVHALGDARDPVRKSRWCHEFVATGTKEGVIGRYLEWLERDGPRGAVILPCDDYGVEMIARNRGRLRDWGYLPVEGDDDVMLAMLDTERTYALARAAGVATPRSATVRSADDALSAAAGFELPVGLKPLQSHEWAKHRSEKFIVAATEDELREVSAWAFGPGVPMLMTEVVPGPETELCTYFTYVDRAGEPVFDYTKSKIRQWPKRSGLTCYQVSDRRESVIEAGRRLVQGIGLRGVAVPEFKHDPRDGGWKLIECNHRFTGSLDLTRHCGIDMTRIAYDATVGRPFERPAGYRTGVTQWNPIEDVRALIDYRRDGELTVPRWVRSVARRQHFPMMRADDPMPTVASLGTKLGRAARKLARKR
ncbi:MAG: D-aspartate ligase [Thermoleophilaceae bacterium]|nr:D-aspartate ligase [Thermoleophilaceae bacterium]